MQCPVSSSLSAMSASRKRPRPPIHRAILALDLDCFYAQVAIRSRPHLSSKPVVVVQKHLCVTSNYVARRLTRGSVQKMTPISQALKACPDLVCIDGSDLTPFRNANKEVLTIVRTWLGSKVADALGKVGGEAFDCPCKKLGFDEVFIDVSRLVECEIAAGGRPWAFEGHVFGSTDDDDVRRVLMVASQLAAQLRVEITEKTKLTLCAGISDTKLLAKLAVNMHKPNDQTAFLPGKAAQYIATRPPRTLPGFGYAAQTKVVAWASEYGRGELRTAADVLRWFGEGKRGLATLSALIGSEDSARKILDLCRGVDASPVVESGDAPKSLTSMDSFRTCTTVEDVQRRVTVRAKDLVTRLLQDAELHARRPKTLSVGFRFRGDGFHGVSRAVPMPAEIVSLCSSRGGDAVDASVAAIAKATLSVLEDHRGVSASANFDMTLISVGATNFNDRVSEKKQPTSQKISSFFESRGVKKETASKDAKQNERSQSMKPRTDTTWSEVSTASTISQCPICNRQLASSLTKANIHVDECLRRLELNTKPKKRPKTVSNTRRVDSFFQRR